LKKIKDNLSPGLVVGLLALFVALGGTAYAIGRNSVGTAQLKKNAVSTIKIRNGAVTAVKLRDYRRIGRVKRVVATDGADAETARAAAPRILLFRSAPFTIYAKCFSYGTVTEANAYISTSRAGSIFSSDEDYMYGNPFLNPGTVESERELNAIDAGPDAAAFYGMHSTEVAAISPDGTSLEARLQLAAKRGILPGGNGLYGDGSVCLFSGDLTRFAD
jgi:hypothetical protein